MSGLAGTVFLALSVATVVYQLLRRWKHDH